MLCIAKNCLPFLFEMEATRPESHILRFSLIAANKCDININNTMWGIRGRLELMHGYSTAPNEAPVAMKDLAKNLERLCCPSLHHSIRGLKFQAIEMSSYRPVPSVEGEDGERQLEHEKHENPRSRSARQASSSLALPASIVFLCISLINLFIAKRFYRPTNAICTA